MLEVFRKIASNDLVNADRLDFENRGVIVYFWTLSRAGRMEHLHFLS